jgi:hypothetical protein
MTKKIFIALLIKDLKELTTEEYNSLKTDRIHSVHDKNEFLIDLRKSHRK